MTEDTQNLGGGRSFEERVFARFDAMDMRFDAMDMRFDAMDMRFDAVDRRFNAFEASVNERFEAVDKRFDGVDLSIKNLDERVEKLEARSFDTKPIWEQALKEILETKREVVETRRDLSKRLARLEAVAYETRADLRDAEDRIDKLESRSP